MGEGCSSVTSKKEKKKVPGRILPKNNTVSFYQATIEEKRGFRKLRKPHTT